MKKETGLMFKAPLVRAILSGQKTQTRRVMKPQPASCTHDAWPTKWVGEGCEWHCAVCGNGNRLNPRAQTGVSGINCPMGQSGDRIYVRETWQGPLLSNKEWEDHYFSDEEALPRRFETPAYCQYAADGGPPPEFTTMDDGTVARWKPSIHMPKWAARIWLEITGVRVERLQQITEADALAEGVDRTNTSIPGYARERFQRLWDSTTGHPALPANTNSKRYARVKRWLDTHPDTTSWPTNPWVWAIDFKTISTTGRPA